MKRISIYLRLSIIIVFACLLPKVTFAEIVKIDGIYYDLSQTSASVSYGTNKYTGDITIPESVTYNENYYSVTSIGSYAFNGCSGLISVTIPNSVTTIGNYAFKNCSGLTSITIGNSVTSIGREAFYGCSGLTSITIGNNVTSIGREAFYGCSGLTSITIGNNVTSIGYYAFQNCSGLKKVIISDIAKWCSISFGTSDANPLTYAHHLYSDENTEIKELIIPNSVTKISSYAFSGCSGLASVTIPNSMTSIDISAFEDCSGLKKVIISDIAKWCSISFGDNPLTYAHHLYSDENTEIKELIIPNSVTMISSSAFSGCSGLTSVTIPNSVTYIGGSAFSGCSGLTSVTINSNSIVSANYPSYSSISNIFGSQVKSYILGDQINSIGSYFFSGCSELTSITIGNSVTSIGKYAFQECSGLTSISIPNSVTSIGYGAFQNCSGLKKVIVSDIAKWCSISFGANPLTYAHHLYSDENTEIKELIIPNSVTKISSSAFSGCSGLASATIGNSVTNIEEYAFSGCSGLASATIGNSVTSIGESAFNGCLELTNVTLNSNSIVSKNYTSSSSIKNFFGTQVKSYIFGDQITSIGNYAFNGCSGLTSVTIPNSVTSIGESAFNGCLELTSVTLNSNSIVSKNYTSSSSIKNFFGTQVKSYIFGDQITSIGNYAFNGCSTLTSITIPNSVTTIGEYAFKNCSGLTSISISKSMTRIEKSTFSGCSGLTTITIPNNVTSIGESAFYGCSGLSEVTIPNSVTSIGKSAFDNTYLKSVTIGTGVLSIGSSAFPYNTSSSGSRPVKVIWLTNTPPDGYKNAEGEVNYVANNLYSLSNKTVYPFLSSMFEVNGIKYVPVSPSERTCDAIDCMYNESLENITISQTVQNQGISFTLKEIKPYVFNRNPYIKNVTIESNYTGDIPSYAFSGCSNLQGVVIPDAVTNIGQSSFSGCSKMTFVKIGSGVTSIPTYAFYGCSALNDMQIGQNVQTIDEYAFYRCRALKSITIPKSVTSINNNVFSDCSALENVTIEDSDDDSVLSLGFNGSPYLSNNTALFSDCPLDEVYIGRNISYSKSPFYRNTSLRSVTITDRETEISPNEFYGCTNLKDVKIGDGVTTIGNRAFSGCSSLDYFSFGSAVQTIGQEAFSDCTAMTKLISKAATPPTCGTQALDDINKWNCRLQVPAHTLSLYQAAPQWKEFFFIEEATGIKGITGDNPSSKATITTSYDLNGKQFSQPQKGLNILKMSDGTTRKVVK